MFKKLFSFSDEKKAAHKLYIVLVEQARQPAFYKFYGVADTVAGRFDMITMHAVLLLRRLADQPMETKALSQALFDYMFDDFDLNLRELGVGDTGIGKRIKKMGTGFYGRLAVYTEGLDGHDDQKLSDALNRNLYREMNPTPENLADMVNYMHQISDHLAATDMSDVVEGKIRFEPPSISGNEVK